MSDTVAAVEATAQTDAYIPPTFDVQDVRDELGFADIEDLAPDTRETKPEVDEVAEKREAKTKPVDDDVAELKAIEARAKERRKARSAARAKSAPVVAQTATTPAAPAKPVTLGPVEQAVKDTIAAIERLAQGDADAAAGEPAPTATARNAEMAAITAKLDALQDGLKQTEEGKKQIEEMRAQLKELNDDRIVRHHVAKSIEKIADELPTLTDSKAIRAFNKEHGTDYTDAVEMVKEAAERYWAKYKAAPDMADLAKRIEKKLVGDSAEQDTAEKPTKKSKTVTRNDASPPAARTGPDERSYDEVMADFNRKFGLD